MPIIFVVTEVEYARAEEAIAFAARDDAFASGHVQLWMQLSNGSLQKKIGAQFSNSDNWEPVTWSLAVQAGEDSYIQQVRLVYSKVVKKVPTQVLRSSGVLVDSIENVREYFTKQSKELRRALSASQLSWHDQVLDNFGNFRHGVHIASGAFGPDRQQSWSVIESWIKQFDQFGARGVGESLARLLLVQRPEVLIATSEIATALPKQQLNFLAALSGLGKSGGVLLQNAAKYVQQNESGCIGKGITRYAEKSPDGTLHVIEDGLWTGFEFLKVLDALERKKPHPAIQALNNLSDLETVKVRLHFLLATDIGVETLKSILQERKLKNFELAPFPIYITVLSDTARKKFESGEYTFHDVMDDKIPASEIEPAILSEQRPWLDDKMKTALAKLIEEKAGLLYPVPEKLQSPLHQAWPYGASFIGSNIVFAHSSPRAAVPFYWKSGVFQDKRKQVNWNALVPETVEFNPEDESHS